MTNPPSGTVTFLFTDIEGSTKLAQQYPAIWETLRARHHSILQGAMDAHNGYVFQIIGDAFCVAFHTAMDGLNAAVEAQRKLQVEDWGETPIQVRMGIHTGSAECYGTDYRGYLTMAKVQRVMSVAYGGQVLLSNSSAELIHSELPAGVTLRDLKEHRLKGLPDPERLWQMVAADIQSDFPSLSSLNEVPNNLPLQLTTFIGRQKEINQIKQQLQRNRLVTLTGSGGVGKTRLSIQVASEVLDEFPHGVFLVELAPVTDPGLVTQTVCAALDVTPHGNTPALTVLTEYLKSRKILLVVDNCEHLIDACAQLCASLLHACPVLRILASSREALGIEGEYSYRVPSLSLPQPKDGLQAIQESEAVKLFTARAIATSSNFELMQSNAPMVAQICQRLDGIALAIELAASRVKLLKVEQIASRLDDAFRLLTGGNRTALPRQQTLRALIDWSYNLLSNEEKTVLRQLSVFVGGWTLEAAEEICAGDGIETYDVLDLLTQLVNKSLVIVIEHSQSGETRYRMLETIRQYAREKLVETGGSEIIRDKHLAYFVKLVEQAEPELYSSNQVFWFKKLDDELDNFRLALEWALTTDVESGLRVVCIPWRFWQRYDYQEAGDWLGQLLERYPKSDSLRAQALAVYSRYTFQYGNFAEAPKIAEQGLQLTRALSDRQNEALSLLFLGDIMYGVDYHEAAPLLEQSLALYRTLGDKIGQAMATGWLGEDHNDLERSKSLLLESLKLHRDLGNLSDIAWCLSELARQSIYGGDFSSTLLWLEEARTLCREIGDETGEGDILIYLGTLAYWQSDYQQACAYFEQAITLYEKIGSLWSAWARIHMAYALLRQGNIAQAKETFEIAFQHFSKNNAASGWVYAIEGLASLHLNQNQPERAARLFACADAIRDEIGDHRPPIEQASVERDLAVIHSKLNEVDFENAYNTGRSMTIEQAITLALKE